MLYYTRGGLRTGPQFFDDGGFVKFDFLVVRLFIHCERKISGSGGYGLLREPSKGYYKPSFKLRGMLKDMDCSINTPQDGSQIRKYRWCHQALMKFPLTPEIN